MQCTSICFLSVLNFLNPDLDNVVSPVKPKVLRYLLEKAGYPSEKTDFLVKGFTLGFDLGYRGPTRVRQNSPNLKFTIGDEVDLWNKVMKEVELKRFAGPFDVIPFSHYIQSPIGLVPKDGGTKTRLIFHLSYPKSGSSSVNFNTPDSLSKVKYSDFDQAVRLCLQAGQFAHGAKSDLSSAFRQLGVLKKFWKYLVMKAKSPIDGK